MTDPERKPKKGILKNSSSIDKDQSSASAASQQKAANDKEMKWDEMNILATYHPADKDYGHDKINEPPTPYNRVGSDGEEVKSGDEAEASIDPQHLIDSLSKKMKTKVVSKVETSSDEDDDEEEENLTAEEKERRKAFMKRRKLHYNEFQAVKLARQLLDEDEDEDEEASSDKVEHKDDVMENDVASDDDAMEVAESKS